MCQFGGIQKPREYSTKFHIVNSLTARLKLLLLLGAAVAALIWGPGLMAMFFPPDELLVRVFKHEGLLETWTRSGHSPFTLRGTYVLTAASGLPGPKRQEGDRQVPEGFYHVDRFNPQSLFHLSLGLDYPNASDRILSDPVAPGSDIFIHGGAASIGCLPIGDPAIEEVYHLAEKIAARGRSISVHIFPARMSGPAWANFREAHTRADPTLAQFWDDLEKGYSAFAKTHQLPAIEVAPDGRYVIRE